MLDFTKEIKFKTARSGGKGGQNVNKVETMVEGYWHIDRSVLFTPEQKEWLKSKLYHKINAEGYLLVKNQTERTQLGNKQQVIWKIHLLVAKAIVKPKTRKAMQIPKAVQKKRIESKKRVGEIKSSRKKINPKDF